MITSFSIRRVGQVYLNRASRIFENSSPGSLVPQVAVRIHIHTERLLRQAFRYILQQRAFSIP